MLPFTHTRNVVVGYILKSGISKGCAHVKLWYCELDHCTCVRHEALWGQWGGGLIQLIHPSVDEHTSAPVSPGQCVTKFFDLCQSGRWKRVAHFNLCFSPIWMGLIVFLKCLLWNNYRPARSCKKRKKIQRWHPCPLPPDSPGGDISCNFVNHIFTHLKNICI